VAAIAEAYHATRSDQRGSNLYHEMCPLIIATTGSGGFLIAARCNLLFTRM
jgi:hypothetical protein